MVGRLTQYLLVSVTMAGLSVAGLGVVHAQDTGASSTQSAPGGAGTTQIAPGTAGSGATEPTASSTPPAASPPAGDTSTQPEAAAGTATTTPPAVDAASSAPTTQVPVAETADSQAIPDPYLTADAQLSSVEVETWLAAPRSVIEEIPIVPERVSARVERLIGSDSRVVPPMIQLAIQEDISPEQRAMIIVGAARATRSAETVAPEYAAYIQEVVARSGSESLIAAYNVALQTTDIETASLGGAAAGGGAGPGSGSLNGGGESGPAGAIGGDDVVPQGAPTGSSRGARSVAVSNDDNGGNRLTTGGNGTNGSAGGNGTNGTNGPTGPSGTNGSKGEDGEDGTDVVVIIICQVGSPVTPDCTLVDDSL